MKRIILAGYLLLTPLTLVGVAWATPPADGGTALPEASVVLHGAAAVAEYGLRIHQPSAVLRPALVNGAMGMVVTLGGQPVAIVGFTVSGGKVLEIDVLADPERLRRLDVASLA
jgi:RNA polymerase sigma-70 factor (ECF subfamily)